MLESALHSARSAGLAPRVADLRDCPTNLPRMALSHVILHVGLCSAIARASESARFNLQLRLVDLRGNVRLARGYRIERGDDDTPKIVEFDMPPGAYGLSAVVAQYGCSASDFITILDGHDRGVNETLASGASPPPKTVLFSGSSPQSFLYVNPTFVLLNKNTNACDKPAVDFVPLQVNVENDQDAYYAALDANPSGISGPVQLALRLKTPTHQYHYIRVPIPFPPPWGGFPEMVHFDVTQDEVDNLATQPVNTLLCLKLWETKVHL
jgi:hypothetical protein